MGHVLYIALLKREIMACGTILLNKKNIPLVLKDLSTLDKARGSNKYVRIGICYLFNGEIIRL